MFTKNREARPYKKIKLIGRGGYGKIYLIEDKSDQKQYALKKMFINKEQGVDFTTIREIKILKNIKHENIIEIKKVFIEKESKICMSMKFYDTDLSKLIDSKKIKLEKKEIKYIIKEIIKGLNYLHINKILHRDIKPGNILINKQGEVVLTDFGLSRPFIKDKKMTKGVITRWYRPPEILFGATFYSTKIDIWSLGCIFAELFLKKPIFRGETDIDQLSKIFGIRGTANDKNWKGCEKLPYFFKFEDCLGFPLSSFIPNSEVECRIIEDCLQLDPRKRPVLKDLLESEYFVGIGDEGKESLAEKVKLL